MVQISPAAIADLPKLIELENMLFSSDRIPPRQFRYILSRANGITVKIEENGMLAGYLILLKRRNCGNLRIYSIGINPAAQHRGYARSLVDYAIQTAAKLRLRRVTLEVCEHNSAALKLYAGAGFYRYGVKIGYYQDGCTALLLRKDLEERI
jgi:ribosomal protein S18 acetylase RimI-like enzyme